MGSLRDASVVAEIGSLEETKVDVPVVGGAPFVSQFHVSPGTMTLRVDVQALDSKTPLRMYLYDCSAEQKFDCKLWDMPFEATARIISIWLCSRTTASVKMENSICSFAESSLTWRTTSGLDFQASRTEM